MFPNGTQKYRNWYARFWHRPFWMQRVYAVFHGWPTDPDALRADDERVANGEAGRI